MYLLLLVVMMNKILCQVFERKKTKTASKMYKCANISIK